MNQNHKNYFGEKFVETVVPYLIFGIAVVLFFALLVVFFYLIVWGIAIGLILWAIMAIKEKFFPSSVKVDESVFEVFYTKQGRVIDVDNSHHTQKKHKEHREKK